VKTNISSTNPFFVRVGICYTRQEWRCAPHDASKFSIKRGYKSWGGNGVNFNDKELEKYFVILDVDHSFDKQHCRDLDQSFNDNVTDLKKGCPANGVVAAPNPSAPDGGCPAPSGVQDGGKPGNTFPACVYPTSDLTSVTSIGDLLSGGSPDLTKYYYDAAKDGSFLRRAGIPQPDRAIAAW